MSEEERAFKEFARWRKRQKFVTPELAAKAGLVEADLHLLTTDAGRIEAIREAAAQNVREFRAMLTQAS